MIKNMYIKGRNKEYKICKQLRDEGYDIVQRTAGSHSPIDIIAIDKKNRSMLLIQAKSNKLPPHAVNKILKELDWLDGDFNVEVDVR